MFTNQMRQVFKIFVVCMTCCLSVSRQASPSQSARVSTKKLAVTQKDPDQPCFTKKEVRDIIFERNELKTNLFLVQEELNYYQRWVYCVSGHI